VTSGDVLDGRLTGRVPVRFAAVPRLTELTWSQQYYLGEQAAAAATGHSLAIRRLFRLRNGISTADVTNALRDLLERYEVLRSGTTVDGSWPRQVVASSGFLEVMQWDTEAAVAAARLGDGVLIRLGATPFDLSQELPVRAAIIYARGEPRHLALAFSHVAVDGYAVAPIAARLIETCAVEDPVSRPSVAGPAEGFQPYEQVDFEASPAGQRMAGRALAHAEAVLRAMPPADSSTPATGSHQVLSYRSPALDLAVGAVCARTRASPAAVLMAAAAVVSAAKTGTDTGYLSLIAANRLRPQTVSAVMPLSQPVPCLVDVTGASFDEIVGAAARASLSAFRYASYPPAAFAALQRRIERERGAPLDTTPTLNYRPHAAQLPIHPVMAEQLADADTGRTLSWLDSDSCWQSSHYLSADVGADGIRLSLQVDAGHRSPAGPERWLRAVEDTIRAAAALADGT
jgi:Condensation domain